MADERGRYDPGWGEPRTGGWHRGWVSHASSVLPITTSRAIPVVGAGMVLAGLATALATFLLYSNLPVALARRGIVPTAVAAAVPGLLFLAVCHRLLIQRRPVEIDRTFFLILGFLAVLLTSAFVARGYAEATARIMTFVSEGLITYILIRNAIHNLPGLRVAMIAVFVAAALVSGLALVQATTRNYEQEFFGLAQRNLDHLEEVPIPTSSDEEMGREDRALGPVGDPNRFAQILLMAVPLALVLGLNATSKRGKVAAYSCAAIILGGVLVTYSRGGFVALVIMTLLLGPLGLVRPRRLLALSVVGLIFVPFVAPAYMQRVASISGVAALWGSTEVEADGATRGRTTEMLAALAAYTDHAVLGVGPGQYLPFYSVEYQALPEISIRELAVPRRAHSLYLELAAETGTVGLLVFLAIPILLLRDLRALRLWLYERRPDLARVAAGFTLVLLAYLGTGMFLHLAFERYYWFMIGLTAAAAGVLQRAACELEQPATRSTWPTGPSTI